MKFHFITIKNVNCLVYISNKTFFEQLEWFFANGILFNHTNGWIIRPNEIAYDSNTTSRADEM